MEQKELLKYLKSVLSMAKVGLSYSENPYDLERYEALAEQTMDVLSSISNMQPAQVQLYFDQLDNYPTPKVDVRGILIERGKILLIRERIDRKWSLPGGWCDIGISPAANIEKEFHEESGLIVSAKRLLAVWDKERHNHPPDIHAVYKLNFHCELVSGTLSPGHEALDAAFFDPDELPELSLPRNTASQIKTLYTLAYETLPTQFD